MPHAGSALNALMQEADIVKVGRRQYLVAPLSPELVDTLIIAAGATEDDEDGGETEENGDDEVSLGWHHPHALNAQYPSASPDDLESDGLEDEVTDGCWGSGGGEAALGWANEGSQLSLGLALPSESEPELGWSNTGPQTMRETRNNMVEFVEGDGNCDAEPDVDDEPDDDDMGIDDFPMDEPNQDREPSLAGISAGMQSGISDGDLEGDVYLKRHGHEAVLKGGAL